MVQTTRTVAHEPSVLVPPRGVTRPKQNALHSRTIIQAKKKNTAQALETKNALHDALALVQQNQMHDALALAHHKTGTRDALAPVYQDQRHATHLNSSNKQQQRHATHLNSSNKQQQRHARHLHSSKHCTMHFCMFVESTHNERSHSSKQRTTHIRTRRRTVALVQTKHNALLHSFPRKRACTLVPRNAHALKKRTCARQITKKNTNLSKRATEQSLEMHKACKFCHSQTPSRPCRQGDIGCQLLQLRLLVLVAKMQSQLRCGYQFLPVQHLEQLRGILVHRVRAHPNPRANCPGTEKRTRR